MKVKALINCVGIGYKLNAGEEADLKKEVAEKLIKFKYAEEVKKPTPKK